MLRVLRPKAPSQIQQDQLRMASVNLQGSQPQAQPQAFSGSPATLSGQKPRLPGNVAPAPVSSLDVNRVPGFEGPRQPPQQPAPGSLPGAPAAPAPAAPPQTAVPGQQNAGAPAAPATQDDIDQMIRDLVASQLAGAGKANTAEEEALIRQRMQAELGGSLVNQRARAGRAGFAASGALQAQEGDIMRAAEMDALDQVLGLRRTEDQRSIENAMGAIGAEQGMRRAASDDALRRMALEALQAEMGLDGDVAADGGGMAPPAAVMDPIMGAVGAETEAPALPSSGDGDAGMSSRNPIIVSQPPAGASLVNQSASFGGALYLGADGKYYGVR